MRSCFGLCAAALLALANTACIPHYEARRLSDAVHNVSEDGKAIRLVEVGVIYDTGNPFGDYWSEVLVEPAQNGGPPGDQGELPRWPMNSWIPQSAPASMRQDMPTYRSLYSVRWAARYVNRELGSFRTAWIIGTHPLAVAFMDDNPDPATYMAMAQPSTLPSTAPGVMSIHTRSGRVVVADRRQRYERFVDVGDLMEVANVVVIWPPELDLAPPVHPTAGTQPSEWQAKVLILSQPVFLRDLIQGLCDPESLARDARAVIDVPVHGH